MASKTTNTPVSSSLDPKMAATLCYVPAVGWIAAIVFLIVEKNHMVRWNAAQALALFVGVTLINAALGVTIFLLPLVPLVNIAGMIVLPLVLAVKAYQGQTMRLPFLAELADKFVGKV